MSGFRTSRNRRSPAGVAFLLSALVLAFLLTSVCASTAHAAFGIEAGSLIAKAHAPVPLEAVPGQTIGPRARIANTSVLAAAEPDTQAGDHPDATVSFSLVQPGDQAKDIITDAPPGLVGDPQAVPACGREAFERSASGAATFGTCQPSSQVGVATVRVNGGGIPLGTTPVYLITAAHGVPASFGFGNNSQAIVLNAQVRSDGDYGLRVTSANIAAAPAPIAVTLTLWGVPAASVHDEDRYDPATKTWGVSAVVAPVAFLSNPSFCDSGALTTSLRMDSWQEAGRWLPENPLDPDYSAPSPQPTGCAALHFGGSGAEAALSLQPSVRTADTPAGYEARLNLPYDESPNGLASPTLRNTVVTLPEGVVVNPASANGLGACSLRQIGFVGSGFPLPNPLHFDEAPVTCPDSSKIGTVRIHTPLLDHVLNGSTYLARQYENPFGTLLAIYLAVEDPETGIVVKLAGRVDANPLTGRLRTTFEDNPQLPFTELDLRFFGGAQSSLVNPLTCAQKTTSTVLTPWSAPYTPAVVSNDSFSVEGAPGGRRCVGSEAEAPNTPGFEAGTVLPFASSYSPFVIKLSREDGTQRFKALNLTLPEGLTGRLAGTPYCPDSAIAQAQARSRPGEGALELASPSCSAASQVGTVDVAAGAGSTPVHVQGKAYLAGPYKGAQLSMVVITPAVAGPFDLGTVVVRTPLYVNEETAQISARSDAFPSILEGIPLDIRQVAIDLSKPEFTYTPSSCEAMAVTGEATMTTGQVASLNNRFQVGGCKGLEFAPKLALKVFGKTNRNAKPRLRAVLRAKSGEANIARAQVNLPHSLFLEQNHIKTVCTRVQWTAGAGHGSECPKGSIYGHARAITPLLEKPLEGPVYLRSNGGERKLPDLVAALNGQIDIALWGKVDSGPNHGLRNTFEVVPDAPVSKFILEMRGGKKGLLVNSENLCSKTARKRRAIVRFVGHNGAVESFKPHVANQCGKRHGKKPKAHKRQKAG
jgi:hypothetical protein